MDTDAIYRNYIDALTDGDRRRALSVVQEAFWEGADVATIFLHVFQPALREVGRRWEAGSMTVADEHLATEITETAMGWLYDQTVDGSRRGAPTPTILAAGAPDELHHVGLRMIGHLAEADGWDVVYLGGAVPIDGLLAMIRKRHPKVVALSATYTPHVDHVAAAIQAIRREFGDDAPAIIVGGRPFLDDPGLGERLGADLVAADAATAVELLRDRK
ncbi:MAG TPA: B12-binding domain-containing protein [Longimicrobiales bacterium]